MFWSGAYRLFQGSLGCGCAPLRRQPWDVWSQHGLSLAWWRCSVLAPLLCMVLTLLASILQPMDPWFNEPRWVDVAWSSSRDGLTLLVFWYRCAASSAASLPWELLQGFSGAGELVTLFLWFGAVFLATLGSPRGSFHCVELHAFDPRHVRTWRPCRIRRSQLFLAPS